MSLKKDIKNFCIAIFQKKELIKSLTIRDFKQRYTGTYLGVIWVFFQPLIYIGVIYAVFTFGIRSNSRDGLPFVSYLLVGMIPWIYFSELLNSAQSIIKQHSYLINNINMRLSILPIVKIISTSIPHLILMNIAILAVILNGKNLSLYSIQLIYFFFAMNILLFGIILMASSLRLFLPDIANLITVITQFGFWLTPIVWDISKLPEKYRWLIKLNPVEYIITGYRNSLLYDKLLTDNIWQGIYFWCFALLVCTLGIIVFRKLRPHFAEVI